MQTTCTPSTATIAPAAARLRVPRGGLTVGERRYRPGALIRDTPANRAALGVLTSKAAAAGPIVLGCKGQNYLVEPLPVDASIGRRAFLVSNAARTKSYAVVHDVHGETTCECAHFVYRLAGTGRACKHVAALVGAGLIPPSRPRDAAEPEAAPVPAVPLPPTDGVQVDRPERFRLEPDPRPRSMLAIFGRTPVAYQVVRGVLG